MAPMRVPQYDKKSYTIMLFYVFYHIEHRGCHRCMEATAVVVRFQWEAGEPGLRLSQCPSVQCASEVVFRFYLFFDLARRWHVHCKA